MQFALASRQTSQPFAVNAGTQVAVTPGTGATALVEYTSGTADQVANNTATWSAWTYGATSAAAIDVCATATTVRITSTGGATSVDIAYGQSVANGGNNIVLPLFKWNAALAQQRDGVRNARMAFLGDSTTVGSGSGGSGYTGANGKAKNFVTKLTDRLNKYRIAASSHGLFGSGSASPYTTFDQRVTVGASWIYTPIGAAVGNTVFQNGSSNTAFTFTPAGSVDTFKIWFAKNTGLATFDASIDGGAVTPTATAGTKSISSVTVTAGSVGTHTLSIARTTGTTGNLNILAIEAYDSTVKQITVFNWGWSGSRVTDQAVATNPWDVLNAIPTYAPDLTFIMLTINDANQLTDLAVYKAKMQQLIDACKVTGDVILMSGVPSAVSVSTLANQQQYVDIVRDLANTNGLAFIDNWRKFGSYEVMNALGAYTDTLHPSSLGYSMLDAAIYPFVPV